MRSGYMNRSRKYSTNHRDAISYALRRQPYTEQFICLKEANTDDKEYAGNNTPEISLVICSDITQLERGKAHSFQRAG